MSSPPLPKIVRRPRIPLVWVVPLIALGIAGWMLAREFRHHGPEISIEFSDGAGVEPGKTELEYKGVSVGLVKTVALKRDLSGVVVNLRLMKSAAAVANRDSEFWIVHPEVSLSGIRGLETLVTGVKLNVRPGGGPPASHFKGLDRPPLPDDTRHGRAFVLRSEKLGSLTAGAPVYFREVKVGAVETVRLAEDATAVIVRIRVYTPYIDLVRANSEFWNAGGLAFKVNLLGAELKSTSLPAIFTGGISFATPDKTPLAPVAPDGTLFVLHKEAEKEWLKWEPRIPIHPVDDTPKPMPREPFLPPVSNE
jgi:paraquat-inducible protein B